jgi:hypothetical protein
VQPRAEGVLVDEVDRMVDKLLALAKDRDRRTVFGTNAKAFAATFSWAKSCSALEAAIRSACLHGPSTVTVGFRRFLAGLGLMLFVLVDSYRRYGLAVLLRQISAGCRRRFLKYLGYVK